MLAPRLRLLLASLLLPLGPARAEPAECAGEARVSPCFDADELWLSTTPSPFASLPSPRALGTRELSLLVAAGYLYRPVILVAPAPHPDGREVPVVENTSTLAFGARYGLGYGLDLGVVLPIVPYQNGTGAEGVTSRESSGLTSTTLRDPRVEFAAALAGRRPSDVLAVGTRLVLALPFGSSSALAGYAGPTVAPGVGAELRFDRLTFAGDFGLRFRKAVNFASVRRGSEASVALGAAFEILKSPALGVGLESSLRPQLAGRPPEVTSDSVDLPAEWLASLHFAPRESGPWSLFLAAGSGLPFSYANDPGTPRETTLGVTAPAFRAVLAVRHTLR
jgi:hypothetical protein